MCPGFESQRGCHRQVFSIVGLSPGSEKVFFREDRLSLTSEKKVFKFQINLKRTDTFKRVLDNSLVVLRIRVEPPV